MTAGRILFVTNDSGPNYLYHNLGNGKFEEVGAATGPAYGANGEIYGNMAGDFGDFNRDGQLDLVVTRYSKQPASLYKNDQAGIYRHCRRHRLLAKHKDLCEVGNRLWRFR